VGAKGTVIEGKDLELGYIFGTNVRFEMQGTLKVGLVKIRKSEECAKRLPMVGFF